MTFVYAFAKEIRVAKQSHSGLYSSFLSRYSVGKNPKKDHLWVQVLWKHTLVLKWLETFETKEGKIDHYVTIFSFWRWLIAQNCAWMTSVCKEKRTGEDCSGSGKREMHEKWGQNIIRFVFANFCSHPCKKYGCALRHAAQSSFRASFLNGQ